MSVMLASWLIFQAMAHDQPQVEVKLVQTVKLAVIFLPSYTYIKQQHNNNLV